MSEASEPDYVAAASGLAFILAEASLREAETLYCTPAFFTDEHTAQQLCQPA